MTDEPQVQVAREGEAVAITAGGTLDLTNCQELAAALKKGATEGESVTLDLRPADFIDTQVVQDLARAAITLLNRGKRLHVIVSEKSHPLRVLRISGFEEIMTIDVQPSNS